MIGPRLSMRVRFTLMVTLVASVLVVSAVMFGTTRVRSSIISDLLDTNADYQADEISSNVLFPMEVEAGLVSYGPQDEATDIVITMDDLDRAGLYDPLAQQAGVDPAAGISLLGSFGNVIKVSPSRGVVIDVPIEQAGPVMSLGSLYDLVFLTVDAEQLVLSERFEGYPVDPAFVDELGPIDTAPRDVVLATALRERSGITVLAWADTADVRRSVDRFRSVLWLVTPLVLIGSAIATWLLAGWALRPVAKIADQASLISGGNLDERVPEPGTGDEIDHLARTVNAMLARLESDDARQRRFISDASHELRSPVAVLRSQAELAVRAPEEINVVDYASDVAAESERLGRIVDDMLVLVRVDEASARGVLAGAPPLGDAAKLEIDLDDIVWQEVRRSRPTPVDASGVTAVKVPGRAAAWQRIVRHLLDNAARHANTGVWIGVRSDIDSDGSTTATLWVDDDGSGIAPESREAVFERFARLDEARSRDTGGAGLGLAVVAESVADLGGVVSIEDSPAGGARFVVRIPTTET